MEVGLQLLLSPINTNVVVRTACCTVGVVLPVYSTFKAIESKDPIQQHKWLLYWAAYGTFSVAEVFTDKILSWFPLYYHVKFAFLAWLQLPSVNGASQLYTSHLRPLLLRHQARCDQVAEFIYREMDKFVTAHHAEFKFLKALFLKALTSAHQMVQQPTNPGQSQADGGSFEGAPRTIQDSRSDDED